MVEKKRNIISITDISVYVAQSEACGNDINQTSIDFNRNVVSSNPGPVTYFNRDSPPDSYFDYF